MSISDGVKPARPATLRRDPVVRACQGPARMPRSCILSQTAHVETVQSHAGMPAGHRPSLAWMQRSQQAASSRRRRRTSHRSRCGNATRRSSHGVEGGEHLPATGRRRCDVLHAQDRGGKTHSARGAGLGVAGTGPWVGVASRDGGMRLIYTMQSLSDIVRSISLCITPSNASPRRSLDMAQADERKKPRTPPTRSYPASAPADTHLQTVQKSARRGMADSLKPRMTVG
ncbi:hypothetical protein B2J93_9484 [Marssonina coronariae]|uniref:Uncharacterized protein n=1 Tax=Diplocarpon coronariae TaxID=2795749 RepID=A0A218YXQ1_9HELO|nr:hypothetical protein B2J93_9484 [Marssonina coronariae]